jgi:hypothetical protein
MCTNEGHQNLESRLVELQGKYDVLRAQFNRKQERWAHKKRVHVELRLRDAVLLSSEKRARKESEEKHLKEVNTLRKHVRWLRDRILILCVRIFFIFCYYFLIFF